MDTIETTVFAGSLLNFTCKLFMMRGGTLLILGHGVKSQGQIWHFVYKTLWTRYRLLFCPITFKLHIKVVHDERMNPIDFGSKVKVNLGTLCIKTCWQNKKYRFSPITFKLHMSVMDNERINLIDFGLRSQRSKSTSVLCVLDLVGTIQTIIFQTSHENCS